MRAKKGDTLAKLRAEIKELKRELAQAATVDRAKSSFIKVLRAEVES